MKSFFVILLVESFALSLGGACLLDFKNLDADQKSIHTILCKTATRLSKGSKNYFLPALSFVFEKERRSYILTKSLYKSKGTCFISNDTKNCTNNQLLQIHNMLSLDSCGSIQTIEKTFSTLKSLNSYLNRFDESNRYRLTDSEMIFIGNISQLDENFSNKWIEALVNALKKDQSLTSLRGIELHGFTTRDMCPCCFQHVSDFLKQANDEQNKNTHFFGALIQRLKAEKIVKEGENIPVTFYISSLVKLGREEFNCSRYENYGNACSPEEKVKISPNKNTRDLHCIFLRNSTTEELSTIKDGQENKNAISNANSLNKSYLDNDFYASLSKKSAAELKFPVTEI